jgi:hypothetical protein
VSFDDQLLVRRTRLNGIITAPFLRELQSELSQGPIALIVNKWDIPETRFPASGLIVVRIDWWKTAGGFLVINFEKLIGSSAMARRSRSLPMPLICVIPSSGS